METSNSFRINGLYVETNVVDRQGFAELDLCRCLRGILTVSKRRNELAMATQRLRRVDAMEDQLNKTGDEFRRAKENYDAARVDYEAAREKFLVVRRLALGVLSKEDWYSWRMSRTNVQYTGLKIGEAIIEALETHAVESAREHFYKKDNPPFRPVMSLEEIQEAMERGGFEFRTTTPLREVNAALINLDGVKKEAHGYKSALAEEILKMMKPRGDDKAEALAFATEVVNSEAKKNDDDELPF